MDLLNLDELAVVKREVTIAGKTYALADQTLGQMIETTRLQKQADSDDAEAIFNQMVRTAKSILPDCPEEVLRGLTMLQLQGLFKFAHALDEEVVQAAQEKKEIEATQTKK